jgi:alpha-beta hydrolase superfamily lysophospholipase
MMLKLLGRYGLVLLGGLALAAVVSIFIQTGLIYHPHRYSLADLYRAVEDSSLRLWPSRDEDYRGLVDERPSGERGTVVVFHGNAGSALNRAHYVAALVPLGFRVVLAEYPGYGAREGELNEATLVTDARETVRLAARDFPAPLYVWGESLGSGVATGVAGGVAADPSLPVKGLALITPFSSLPDMAVAVYRLPFLRPFVRDQYDSVANLRGFHQPVAILVSERDELIPREQGQALYDTLATKKRMWTFEGAGHNTWPAGAGERWWAEVAAFLEAPADARASHPQLPTGHKGAQFASQRDLHGGRTYGLDPTPQGRAASAPRLLP